jgi:hypothetical protein
VVCENTLNVALREKGLGRQFRRSHKFDPDTLERDAKEFWRVTLQAMDVVADRYRSLAKARISGGETTDLIKELFPTAKVPAGAKPSAAIPEGCREWHRAYSSLNPQRKVKHVLSHLAGAVFPAGDQPQRALALLRAEGVEQIPVGLKDDRVIGAVFDVAGFLEGVQVRHPAVAAFCAAG